MSGRNSRQLFRTLVAGLAAAALMWAQPQSQQQSQQQPQTPVAANGSVSGSVTNSVTGTPLARAHVVVMIFGNTGRQVSDAVTDAQGKFTIGKLPPGQMILQ